MAIIEVDKSNDRLLQDIADSLASARKIVVVTGAGISTNCGIPDFRSQHGLYSRTSTQQTAKVENGRKCERDSSLPESLPDEINISLPLNIKGKDLFDSMIWKDTNDTATFYKTIASLRKIIREDVHEVSATHRFIRTLRDRGKLVRCYTQNIDGLESRAGLSTDLARGKGLKARFGKKVLESPRIEMQIGHNMNQSGCEVVQLHGDLETLRCTLCAKVCVWQDTLHTSNFAIGKAPRCDHCSETNRYRIDRGKRGTSVGALRPNVVLYGEENPAADAIGTISTNDLSLSAEILLILGTSLHVHGLKLLVREFAKSVHERTGKRGRVIFVNLSRPAESAWKDYIDYWICMDCDEWTATTRKCRPDIWQHQARITGKSTKVSTVQACGKQIHAAELHDMNMDENDKENVIPDSQEDERVHQRNSSLVIKVPSPSTTLPSKPPTKITVSHQPSKEQGRGAITASPSPWSKLSTRQEYTALVTPTPKRKTDSLLEESGHRECPVKKRPKNDAVFPIWSDS